MAKIEFDPKSNVIVVDSEVFDAEGKDMAPIITVKQFRSLGESIRDIDIVCHDLPEEARVDGLVGMNFLRNFDITIHFSSGFIELNPCV